MRTKRLGDIEISAIAEYAGPYRDPLEMFPDATSELVDHHRGWLEPGCIDPESGMLILAFQSFLVRTPRHTILVDGFVYTMERDRPRSRPWRSVTEGSSNSALPNRSEGSAGRRPRSLISSAAWSCRD